MLYTKTGMQVATGYTRVVHGERGSYVEIHPDHMLLRNIHIPANETWRYHHAFAYYVEYRTDDAANVMIYYQRRTVSYADYRLYMCYISPDDLMIMTVTDQLKPFTETILIPK